MKTDLSRLWLQSGVFLFRVFPAKAGIQADPARSGSPKLDPRLRGDDDVRGYAS